MQIPNSAAPPSDVSAASTSTLKSSLESVPQPSTSTFSRSSAAAVTAEESNPWLTEASGSTKRSRKKNVLAGKEAVGAERASVALKKNLARTEEARELERDDAAVEIDLNSNMLEAPKPTKGKKAVEREPSSKSQQVDHSDDEDDDDEPTHGPLAIRQRDLVAQAFAGDNVIEVSIILLPFCPDVDVELSLTRVNRHLVVFFFCSGFHDALPCFLSNLFVCTGLRC